MKAIASLSFPLALLAACGLAEAQTAQTQMTQPDMTQTEITSSPRRESTSWRAAAIGATALYIPLKAGLCLFGGASSVFTYLSSGAEAERTIAEASCKGTWVITPGALKGREQIDFVGQSVRFPED